MHFFTQDLRGFSATLTTYCLFSMDAYFPVVLQELRHCSQFLKRYGIVSFGRFSKWIPYVVTRSWLYRKFCENTTSMVILLTTVPDAHINPWITFELGNVSSNEQTLSGGYQTWRSGRTLWSSIPLWLDRVRWIGYFDYREWDISVRNIRKR